MRLAALLFRNARQPQNENKVPFKAVAPLQLKDRVSSKNLKTRERGCLYEISLLLTCLEEHEHEDKSCIQEIKTLEECYKKYTENMQRQLTEQKQLVPVPNSKDHTHKQITYLLRRYPTI